MATVSKLLLPPPALTSCIAVGVFRDTRPARLSDPDRMNYFPASPLFTVTKILSGQILVSDGIGGLETLRSGRVMRDLDVLGPQSSPTVSWCPGAVAAFTVGFFPDAWSTLAAAEESDALPTKLLPVFATLDRQENPHAAWNAFCEALAPIWSDCNGAHGQNAAANLTDWLRHLMTRLAVSSSGRSVRSVERRLRSWTGQNRQALSFYSKIEELHALSIKTPNASPAELAFDAGFADQSHMGRAVKRATGFSPSALNARIDKDEAFWCYRLMGERF